VGVPQSIDSAVSSVAVVLLEATDHCLIGFSMIVEICSDTRYPLFRQLP
jgi:hypothetical protein